MKPFDAIQRRDCVSKHMNWHCHGYSQRLMQLGWVHQGQLVVTESSNGRDRDGCAMTWWLDAVQTIQDAGHKILCSLQQSTVCLSAPVHSAQLRTAQLSSVLARFAARRY